MSPVGDGPGKAAFKIKGLNNAQVLEFERMADDYRLKRPLKGLSAEVFKSAGGDCFASAAFLIQTINLYQVVKEIRLKEARNSTDTITLLNALFSTIGGGLAAAQGIAITSLTAAIKNYSSAAGKIKLSAKLGRITGALSPFAYFFSFAAAGTGIYGATGSAAKWTEALRCGDGAKLAGASMTLVGDSGQLALNGWASTRTIQYTFEAFSSTNQARALAWVTTGGKLLSVAARANLIGLVLTGLQLGGEWLYNRNNKTELDIWLQKGTWGKQSADRSLADERRMLAEITTAPKVVLYSLNNQPTAVIQLPGITARELDDIGFGIGAYWSTNLQSNDWENWSEPLLYQLSMLSAPDAPLKLGLKIFEHEANAQHGLAIVLRYHPIEGDKAFQEKRFETTTLNAQNGKFFPEVSVLRTRTTNAPWLLVTSDSLSMLNSSKFPG